MPPSINVNEKIRLKYFQMLWKPGFNEFIAHQTNLYGIEI